jgi:hypothetical protein
MLLDKVARTAGQKSMCMQVARVKQDHPRASVVLAAPSEPS